MSKIYDTIIIGGGPSGLAAGLYGGRARMNTLLIERAKFGGQAATTEELENYPGSVEDKTASLITRMKTQAERFGTEIVKDEIVEISLEGDIKVLKGRNTEYQGKTVIIATGANPRLSGFKNEVELRGKGVSYCATCDADFFTDLDVAVVGGGDSALDEALYLTKFAEHVTIIHRRDAFRANKAVQEKVLNHPKIKVIWNAIVEEAIDDDGILGGLKLKDKVTGEQSTLEVDGCFVFVGYNPNSDLFKGVINMTERGDIITDADMHTNIEGVFAAGDVREKSLRQVITAAADGAIAATQAEHYVEDHK
ncbi:thioredoxin-disulfide reductase [Hathewaya limosa]|uniref:Thioredoxin reductase n=1 Tax=Hathewaya limosa TaxID=1536 RepID=A0ABU0JU60_HATLI|nr:thioredoxin-disulfide reductase [Hathewaya limosa]AWZ47820.1 thioredoxin-disulfide reductase [Clostridiaceae bacterium 14S0207]MDQ0480635.1 thioredoxin reductase (NADPH) [Hathewaya limosa]